MGRPKLPAEVKKTARSIKLPEWLWQWIDAQDEFNRGTLIEAAIMNTFEPDPPLGDKANQPQETFNHDEPQDPISRDELDTLARKFGATVIATDIDGDKGYFIDLPKDGNEAWAHNDLTTLFEYDSDGSKIGTLRAELARQMKKGVCRRRTSNA